LGPPQDVSNRSSLQAPLCRSGWRCCLLKGCGRLFRPFCARSRYCSAACQAAARRWQLWKAQRRYRSSEKGRAKRREQARRWRARQRDKQQTALNRSPEAPNPPPEKACEGHHSRRGPQLGKKFSCDRPGCYEGFDRSPRSPWQRFCSALCRQALRLVRLRDRHWQAVCFACSWNRLEPSTTAVRGP
jgi:hypothetical protein